MSGVEVLGLVLGGFPIILSAWDGYKENCQPFRDWWRFEKVLASFLRPVVCEEVFLRQTVQALLSPLVDSEEEITEMCNYPESPLWTNPELDNALRERLALSYNVFFDTVTDMHKQLRKIQKILAVEGGDTAWLMNPTSDWKNQYKRLKFCFKKSKGEKCADILARSNETIARFVERSKTSDPLKGMQKSRISVELDRIRAAAVGLHEVIRQGWNCSCQGAHRAALLLEQRPRPQTRRAKTQSPDEIRFRLYLSSGTETSCPWMLTDALHCTDTGRSGSSIGSSQSASTMSVLAEIQQKSKTLNVAIATTTTKKVSFSPGPEVLAPVTPKIRREVDNLCQTLRNQQDSEDLGYLRLRTGDEYHFSAIGRQVDDLWTMNAMLNSPDKPSEKRLSVRDRIHLAAIISSSVLQLWGTPWLKSRLNKVALQLHVDETSRTSLLVQDTFLKAASRAGSNDCLDPVIDTREVMLRLGIVLLELCFEESIESQPFREDYLRRDGSPSDMTDRMTAIRWQQQVLGALGQEYATVVSDCIDCRFGLGGLTLVDAAFRQSVYANVVEPLQKISNALN